MANPAAREAIRVQYTALAADLAARLSADTLTPDDWQAQIKQALRDSHALMLRAGADSALKYTDYLLVGKPLQKQHRLIREVYRELKAGAPRGIAALIVPFLDYGVTLYRAAQFQKDFADTADSFAGALESTLTDAQSGEINRRNFAGAMRTTLRTEGLVAYRDGMNEVGYDPESFSPEEAQVFKDWLARQSEFVTGLGNELFHEGGISEGEIATRVRMWVHTSLEEIRALGIRMGNKTQRMKWVYNEEAVHCPDCIRLDGQVHTIDDWFAKGILPGNWATACRAGCKCFFEKTDQPENGNYLND